MTVSDQCADGLHDECWAYRCSCGCHHDQLPLELTEPCRRRPRRPVVRLDTRGLT